MDMDVLSGRDGNALPTEFHVTPNEDHARTAKLVLTFAMSAPVSIRRILSTRRSKPTWIDPLRFA